MRAARQDAEEGGQEGGERQVSEVGGYASEQVVRCMCG